MSNTNRHNIYVVKTGDNRGALVRKGGHATGGYFYVSLVEVNPNDEQAAGRLGYTCEHKDNLIKVGCVSPEMWEREYICREGVRRTAESALETS